MVWRRKEKGREEATAVASAAAAKASVYITLRDGVHPGRVERLRPTAPRRQHDGDSEDASGGSGSGVENDVSAVQQ